MPQRQAGALLLALLVACASTTRVPPAATAWDYGPETRWYEVEAVEPGGEGMCPCW